MADEDEDLAGHLKDAIGEKVKTALGEATEEEEEEAEEAADVDSDSDKEQALEEEAKEAEEETSSRRKRTPLFKRIFAVCIV